MARIVVGLEDFDVGAEIAALGRMSGTGAVASFTGYCRSEDGRLAALELEHYPGMAEAELARIAGEAEGRWPLIGVTIIHRFGRITPGGQIVFVGVAATHRGAAFLATDFLTDYLKIAAPFWKKEHFTAGGSGWVSAKADDDRRQARW